MKAIYKLKKKHITLILTKKADSKILKGNTLLQPVRWQASPIPTKNEMKDLKMYINSFYHNLQ